MGLMVMKFGGTSVGSAERIRESAALVRKYAAQHAVVVVVSALAGVTDGIVKILHAAGSGSAHAVESECAALESRHHAVVAELFEPPRRDQAEEEVHGVVARLREVCSGLLQLRAVTPQVGDMALTLGETISANIFSRYLEQSGMRAAYVDSARVVVTDERFGDATPELEATRHKSQEVLLPLLQNGEVPVVTGYRGATASGHLTTLGRGGSDYSATLLGAALNADEIWIWTDVSGVLTADPRLCPDAVVLPEITFAEAVELSYYGAKVIHQRAIRPAMEAGIPVWIRNSFEPGAAGTRIARHAPSGVSPVKAVTAVTRASLLTLTTRWDVHFAEVFGRLFLRLAHDHIDVLFSTQSSSENALGLVLRERDTDAVLRAVKRLFRTELTHGVMQPISVKRDVAVIAVLGETMKGTSGILGRVFATVARVGVSVIAVAQGASELNICFAVPSAAASRVVQAVHQEFFSPVPPSETADSAVAAFGPEEPLPA